MTIQDERAAGRSPGYELSDRYGLERGRVFVSGVQALARLGPDQVRIDRRSGLHTAAFVAGYQGSPLASYGEEAARAARLANDAHVVCNPAVNEELAATAVMGSQLATTLEDCRYDGIVGIWYGKAPGLDRAGDAIRHGVFAGTHRHGGVVALIGDDPMAKSSTLPSSSDATMVDLHMPILFPGDVQEALDLSRHAVALSRASGLWAGLKIVTAVADGTGTIDIAPDRIQPSMPTTLVDGSVFQPHPSGRLLTPYTLDMEREFFEVRSDLARRYAVDNDLNRIVVRSDHDWIGLMASGHTYHEMRQALAILGIGSDDDLRTLGIRVFQLLMPVPLDTARMREFAEGLDEIVVIEEKNPTLERLVRDALYDCTRRPRVTGRRDEHGDLLVPGTGGLDADTLVEPLRRRLEQRITDRLAPPVERRRGPAIPLSVERTPYFCSGCPHNASTRVEEGTLVGGGIGCHAMVAMMEPERVGDIVGLTAMGSEGAQWIGMAPFVQRRHLVQNIGDGTFFHSGSLAIRAAVAAGIDITYKLLYNGTVAMTGGQHASGAMDVPAVARWLLLEGVQRVIVTTDDPQRYDAAARAGDEHSMIPDGVEVWDRTRLAEAQRVLAGIAGVTVLIHDQACAAENRRARHRGTLATPAFRVVINERVCEGCGDCGDKSNCLSVQPVDTPYGRKTRIHQTSCNFDFSCLQGDCPAFATVSVDSQPDGGAISAIDPDAVSVDDLPDPAPLVDADEFNVRISGIGGTGVVTLSQVLGTAAMLDGAEVRGLDQTGLSQKAGPVVSDLLISRRQCPASNHISQERVDCFIATDLLVAASENHRRGAGAGRTVLIASTTEVPTGRMVVHPTTAFPTLETLTERMDAVSRPQHNRYVDAGTLTTALFGSAMSANMFIVGVAVQAGALPLPPATIERAIELNGVAVTRNIAAFRWGRRWAAEPTTVDAAAGLHTTDRSETLDELIERLATDLCGHSSARLARRYRDLLAQVREREHSIARDSQILTRTVAVNLHKLMAYKDEYEVARLLMLDESRRGYEEVGGRRTKVTFLLHPPILRALGVDRKIRLRRSGAITMRLLRHGKFLRGSLLDPFRWGEVRRHEREMIPEYEAAVRLLCERLSPESLHDAVEIAALADQVRGYEHIKIARARAYREELASRLDRYQTI